MSKYPKLSTSITLFSAVILTACGGGGGNSFVSDDKPSFVVDTSKRPLDPLNVPPTTVRKFLTEKMAGIGQQGSPTVVSVDNDNNQRVNDYDRISFDQSGVVSEICEWDGTDCSDNGRLEALTKAVATATGNRDRAQENLIKLQSDLETENQNVAQAQDALKHAPATGHAALQAALAAAQAQQAQVQAQVDAAQQALAQAEEALKKALFNNSTPTATGSAQQREPGKGVVVMRDVNGQMHTIAYGGTTDRGLLKSVNVQKVISSPDAGISKIERIRIRDKNGNAHLQPYGGQIPGGREFNGVVVFDRNFVPEDSGKVVPEEVQYLDAYFRDPAMSGWSFQTFGNFKSQYLDNRRDVLVGYQSIGQNTRDGSLPDNKFAEYRGISHAYINNDKQVTMQNYIRANFKTRDLEYKTLDQAVLHTFEGPNKTHVIEMRPDLNISGSASWDRKSPFFRGTVRTASGLTGQMNGSFYGPQAAEIGGVFGIEGMIDGEHSHYVGGFGAKRP